MHSASSISNLKEDLSKAEVVLWINAKAFRVQKIQLSKQKVCM